MSRSVLLARRGSIALFALSGALLAAPSRAQPAPAAPPAQPAAPGAAPRTGQPAPDTPRPILAPGAAPAAPAAQAALPPAAPDPIAIALAPKPGGLTAEQVGRTAATTRASVRARRAELEAAEARVAQALVNYFPRVSLSATYTRLSPLDPADVSIGGGAGPGGGLQLFKIVLDSIAFVGSVSVPVSDYLFRITQGYSSAVHARKGSTLTVEAETLQVTADAKIVFYNWVRAQGGVVVGREAVEQARAHVDDANKLFSVGLVSRADVLRLEAQVASAQQLFAEAQSLSVVAGEQLRMVLGLPPERPIAIGSDVMHEQAAPPTESLEKLQSIAMERRLEIRSLDETILSLKETVSLARAGYAPRIDAFADLTYAKPNQRVFLVPDEFRFTWAVGARASWTLNDTFSALGATSEAKARMAQVSEQKGAIKEGLRVEVASAYADTVKAVAQIEAAERGLVAAEETLRVRRELFRNGKATSIDIVDAETEVTRARLNRINARIGMLTARVRLDHAVGRDVPQKLLSPE